MSPEPINAPRVQAVASAYWQSAALHAAVQVGLMAELAQAPATAQILAGRLDLDVRALQMLLDALVALGFVQRGGGNFGLAREARPYFTPGGQSDLSNAVLHMADMMPDWARLSEAIKSGRPIKGSGDGQERRQHFYRAMRDLARQQAPGLAAILGLRAGQHLLDLGGGPGVYALTFAEEVPGLRCTVFDLPESREHFKAEAARHANSDNVHFAEGDYRTDPLGAGYDVIWLSQVLHGDNPENCARLVADATLALAPGGVLWIQEFVLNPQGGGHPWPALFGLNMLVNTDGGKSYTAAELTRFMEDAGLAQVAYLGATREGGPAGLMRGVRAD